MPFWTCEQCGAQFPDSSAPPPSCPSEAIEYVRSLGGLKAIAISHPHFYGAGAEGRDALLTGDIATVSMDRRSVSFMYSHLNNIPQNARSVRRIAGVVEPLAFDRIYGAWWDRNIVTDAKAAFNASVRRYLAAIS